MSNGEQRPIQFKRFFTYSVQTDALAAAAQTTKSVQIQADSDFAILHLTGSVYTVTDGAIQNAGDLAVAQLITVQLTDTGSGVNVFDRAQPLANIFGTGVRPYILTEPYYLSANSQFQVTIANGSTTGDLGVYLSFIGKKLFRSG